jgi:8-oxo-dGTP diphosphatase
VGVDEKYTFLTTVACKVIVRKGDKILLTQEPEDHTWMPGRWGLPGGKVLLNEDIIESARRKLKEETGLDCEMRGLMRMVDVLMPEKNHYAIIFVADYKSGDLGVSGHYTQELEWVDNKQVEKLKKDDFAEYFYKQVLKDYFSKPNQVIPLDFVIVQPSFRDNDVQAWMAGGKVNE